MFVLNKMLKMEFLKFILAFSWFDNMNLKKYFFQSMGRFRILSKSLDNTVFFRCATASAGTIPYSQHTTTYFTCVFNGRSTARLYLYTFHIMYTTNACIRSMNLCPMYICKLRMCRISYLQYALSVFIE